MTDNTFIGFATLIVLIALGVFIYVLICSLF